MEKSYAILEIAKALEEAVKTAKQRAHENGQDRARTEARLMFDNLETIFKIYLVNKNFKENSNDDVTMTNEAYHKLTDGNSTIEEESRKLELKRLELDFSELEVVYNALEDKYNDQAISLAASQVCHKQSIESALEQRDELKELLLQKDVDLQSAKITVKFLAELMGDKGE